MPQFFFHTRYNKHLVLDDKGLNLSDLRAAVREAQDRTKWLQEDSYYLDMKSTFWFEISDETGKLLAKIAISRNL